MKNQILKKISMIFVLLIMCFMVCGCSNNKEQTNDEILSIAIPTEMEEEALKVNVKNHELFVEFKTDFNYTKNNKELEKIGVKNIRKMFEYETGIWCTLEFKKDVDITKAYEQLLKLDYINFVEYNYINEVQGD